MKIVNSEKIKKDFYWLFPKKFSLKKAEKHIKLNIRMEMLQSQNNIDIDLVEKLKEEYLYSDEKFIDMLKRNNIHSLNK